MFPPSTLLNNYLLTKGLPPGLFTLLARMTDHQLEASRIEDFHAGVKIIWENGFNKTHKVEISFYYGDEGPVIAVATDCISQPWEKEWVISELSPPNWTQEWYKLSAEELGIIQLTIDESLEYIRHFIWANHNI